MTNSIVDQITDAIIKVAKATKVTGVHMTHETFEACQAEQNAGSAVPMIEPARDGVYKFGAVPITRVAQLPDDAPNQNFMLILEGYEDDENDD